MKTACEEEEHARDAKVAEIEKLENEKNRAAAAAAAAAEEAKKDKEKAAAAAAVEESAAANAFATKPDEALAEQSVSFVLSSLARSDTPSHSYVQGALK